MGDHREINEECPKLVCPGRMREKEILFLFVDEWSDVAGNVGVKNVVEQNRTNSVTPTDMTKTKMRNVVGKRNNQVMAL